MDARTFEPAQLRLLFDALVDSGYGLVGPHVQGGTIVYGEIQAVADLPIGVTVSREPGMVRLATRPDEAYFGFTVAAESPKRYLHPPGRTLFHAARNTTDEHDNRIKISAVEEPVQPRALIGVRSCDLAGMEVLSGVLGQGDYADAAFLERRQNTFIVAVNCLSPDEVCFCASVGTGPEVTHGADIVLTEMLDEDQHVFVARGLSPRGIALTAELYPDPASPELLATVARKQADAIGKMGRHLQVDGLVERLAEETEHPKWQQVSQRCLACGNCTMVCPTCYCTTTTDSRSLNGSEASRELWWDSCFSADFSQLGQASVRDTTASRYRHWLRHKLSTWHDQFGSSGCVGCGRCIAWCPTGIDITELANMQ